VGGNTPKGSGCLRQITPESTEKEETTSALLPSTISVDSRAKGGDPEPRRKKNRGYTKKWARGRTERGQQLPGGKRKNPCKRGSQIWLEDAARSITGIQKRSKKGALESSNETVGKNIHSTVKGALNLSLRMGRSQEKGSGRNLEERRMGDGTSAEKNKSRKIGEGQDFL